MPMLDPEVAKSLMELPDLPPHIELTIIDPDKQTSMLENLPIITSRDALYEYLLVTPTTDLIDEALDVYIGKVMDWWDSGNYLQSEHCIPNGLVIDCWKWVI